MNKNIIIPLSIIIAAALVGGVVIFSGGNSSSNEQLVAADNLRALELSVPGMFCAGCSASVEAYVSSVPGVKRVQASLTTKSATVVYDPGVVTKEEIAENNIFDIYGGSIVSDEKFSGSVLPTESQGGVEIPPRNPRQIATGSYATSTENK